MSQDPGGWLNRLVGWCFSILLATIALYFAVKLIESIWPALIFIVGALALGGVVTGGIVVFRTWRDRW